MRDAARALFESDPIERHPLLLALAAGELAADEVRSAAIQIGHVVDHFPRLLAAILSNLSDWRLRMPLVQNLFEEHEGVTTVRFTHSNLWSEEAVRSHEDGWGKAFDNLERTLAAG